MALVKRTRLRSIGPVTEVEGQLGARVGRADACNALVSIDTTSHILAGDGSDGKGGLRNVIAHANAGAIALRRSVNKEIGEGGMSGYGTKDGPCHQQRVGFQELHDASNRI